MGFILRWLFAFLLLAATYNPTEYNYARWVNDYGGQNLSIAVLVGLVLLIGYIVYLRATLRSIGALGVALVLGLVAALLWVMYDFGLVDLHNPTTNTWIALATVLGIGLSWSHVRRYLTGQADMDDVDE